MGNNFVIVQLNFISIMSLLNLSLRGKGHSSGIAREYPGTETLNRSFFERSLHALHCFAPQPSRPPPFLSRPYTLSDRRGLPV